MRNASRFSAGNCAAVCVAASLLLASSAFGQIIRTIAGNAINDGRPATKTALVKPAGLALDVLGNVVIADRGNFVVRGVFAASGLSWVLAGGGGIFDDGVPVPGKSAALDYPVFVALDANANVYFSDYNDHRIRKITPAGMVTTVAGTGWADYTGDGGKATAAELNRPTGVAVDNSSTWLYISDWGNSVIRRVNLNTGIIQTFAGNGVDGYAGDNGPATKAALSGVWGLAFDRFGNLFIADKDKNVIRKVDTNGVITTVVGQSAGLDSPRSVAFDPSGNLYIADFGNDQVVRLAGDGSLVTVVGGGVMVPQDTVAATSAHLYNPSAIAFDRNGNLYASVEGWNVVVRVDASTRLIRVVAGMPLDVLDGGQALNAPLSFPIGIALDTSGNRYIADTEHHRVRKITASTGVISTVVGNGILECSPDGTPATSASIIAPLNVSVDGAGNLYFTEDGSLVRKIDAKTGQVMTVAGTAGVRDYAGDGGSATAAKLNMPFQAVADNATPPNIYISDWFNHCIRRVDSKGFISTVAGTCGQSGYSGDGGLAASAKFNEPAGIAFDANGNLLIADSANAVVRRLIVGTGTLQRVAGIPGSRDYSGDEGPASNAELGNPFGLAVDRNGSIYITDTSFNVVRMIRPDRTITTIAGVGVAGFAGEGIDATYAFLNTPTGVAVDTAGNVYIVDSDNNRVRRITAAGPVIPVLDVSPNTLSFTAAQGGAVPPSQSLVIKNSGSGLLYWRADLSTTSGGNWLKISDAAGSAPASLKLSINPTGLQAGNYQGSVTITAAGATGSPKTVSVSLAVKPPDKPALALSTQFVTFEAVQGGAAPSAQILSVSNEGSGALNWGAQFITNRGGNWLSLSPTSGTVTAGATAGSVLVSVNPTGLAAGLYVGLVSVNNFSAAASIPVAVSLLVGPASTSILLSQQGFSFTAAQGSTTTPPQSFQIFNAGQGSMNWQVQSFLPQGNWLRVTPQSGTSVASATQTPVEINLQVDPTGLEPGVYGGLLVITAPGARNNPQFATVVTRILPQGSAPIAQVQPSGLMLTADVGGAPAVDSVTLRTTGGSSLTFTAGTRTRDGGNWLNVSPASGTLQSSTDRVKVRVQVTPGSLPANVYQGAVNFSFSDGTIQEVAVAAIVRAAAAAAPAAAGQPPLAACAPARQVLVSTKLANNFSLPIAWPVPMTALVSDECGSAVTNSTVAASFNNGDPPVVFQNLRNGQHSGTWVPTRAPSAGSPVVVNLRAVHPSLQEATLQLAGSVGLDTTAPAVNDNGIVNGASFAAMRPLSPGGIFSLFGINLAGKAYFAVLGSDGKLPKTLGDVSVKIGGYDAPLFYAGPSQVNGQVPFELAGSLSASVVVTVRGISSVPRTIQFDANRPGIFLIGQTQGAILIANSDTIAAPAGSITGRQTRPAARGEYISIFCTGLGPVSNQPATGAPAPGGQTANTMPSVTIGGVAASDVWAGLAPGFVGLYQVNVRVPDSAPAGDAVELVVTLGDAVANTVTLAVK